MAPSASLIAGAALVLTAGCNVDREARAEWSESRARWEAEGPERYAVVQEVWCECPPPYRFTVVVGPVGVDTVTIAPADAEWMGALGDGYDYADAEAQAMTVEEAFDLVGQALQEGRSLEVEYDRALGYPTRVFVDWEPDVADEETSRAFSGLRPVARR